MSSRTAPVRVSRGASTRLDRRHHADQAVLKRVVLQQLLRELPAVQLGGLQGADRTLLLRLVLRSSGLQSCAGPLSERGEVQPTSARARRDRRSR